MLPAKRGEFAEHPFPRGTVRLRLDGGLEHFRRVGKLVEPFVGGEQRTTQVGALGGRQAGQRVGAFPGGEGVVPTVGPLLGLGEVGKRLDGAGRGFLEFVVNGQRIVEFVVLGFQGGDLSQACGASRRVQRHDLPQALFRAVVLAKVDASRDEEFSRGEVGGIEGNGLFRRADGVVGFARPRQPAREPQGMVGGGLFIRELLQPREITSQRFVRV